MKLSLLLLANVGYFVAFSIAKALRISSDICESIQAPAASTYWYENISHNNSAIFRNVKDMGAKDDGLTDDSAAIQKAITSRTTASVVVYFPAGTYLVNSSFKSGAYTVLIGDPTNRPIIKAGASFTGSVLFTGQNTATAGLADYFHQVKNLIFDSTAVAPTKAFTLITWSLSQGTQLQNTMFNMPIGSSHVGLASTGANSPTFLNDLHFNGGAIGLSISDRIITSRTYTVTGMKIASLVVGTGQGFRFEGVTTGLDMTAQGTSHFNLIDSSATNTKTVVAAAAAAYNSLVLENVIVDSTVPVTVKVGTMTALTGSVVPGQAWIKGNTYLPGSTTPLNAPGTFYNVSRSDVMVNGTGAFHTVVPPTYEDVPASQIVNVKDHSVMGDGTTDDTVALQAIINSAVAASHILFFPNGAYILTDTIKIPAGSRLIGEAWSQLLASGSKFADAKNPKVMVQVGSPGEIGTVQMTDFVFSFKTLSPGAIMLEVNMAGTKPGDVGFFNVFFPFGIQSLVTVSKSCATVSACAAVHMAAHFTPNSSVYFEHTWVTDDGGLGNTDNGAGFLVESQNGAWLHGYGSEHNALYQLAIHNAKNVFFGVHQSEPGYFEINGGTAVETPGAWAGGLLPGEPTYSWCAKSDVACHVSLYQYVVNSANIYLYASGFWDFACSADTCLTNGAIFANNSHMYSFGIGLIGGKNMVTELDSNGNVVPVATKAANLGTNFNGFTPGVISAYMRQSA